MSKLREIILQELRAYLEEEEGKICPSGKKWAMEKYGKWSAYAAMGASRYCKDPTYGRKNESLDEGELKKWREEQWVQADGTPCGDEKAQNNPKRCKPKKKWATMSKGEKKADQAKKKTGGKKGKQFVSSTKKGKVTKTFTKEAVIEEAEYKGKKVTLNNPIRTPDGPKKFKVYVKNDKGNVVIVRFGDPNMEIKRDDPKRRKAFRDRHDCANKKDKTTAGYWSCYQWRAGKKVDN